VLTSIIVFDFTMVVGLKSDDLGFKISVLELKKYQNLLVFALSKLTE
jgi:hypothetical protein